MRVLSCPAPEAAKPVSSRKWVMDENRRRAILVLVGFAALGSANAQSRPARIAVLSVGSAENARLNVEQLTSGLRELGHVPGRTFTVDERFWSGDEKALAPLFNDVLAKKPDVIVTGGTNLTRAAQTATKSTPIIVAFASDLTSSGAVSSYARPDSNLTGFTTLTDVAAGKRLEILAEALPGLRRVALLQNPTHALSSSIEAYTRKVGATLGIEIIPVRVTSLHELETFLDRLGETRVEAILVSSHAMFLRHSVLLIERAMKHKAPVVHWQPYTGKQGAFIAHGIDMAQQHRRAASYVHRILRGARPGDLPIEQVTDYELVVNLRTARALGLKVSQAVLLRAHTVIE